MEIRKQIGMPTLKEVLGLTSEHKVSQQLDKHQVKAQRNIKHCADDQWCWVNSWYDSEDEGARAYLLNASDVFSTIYQDSQTSVYGEGSCSFGPSAREYLKDVRFCGKKFLQTVSLYYTAKLLEEALPEIEATEEEYERVVTTLVELKEMINAI